MDTVWNPQRFGSEDNTFILLTLVKTFNRVRDHARWDSVSVFWASVVIILAGMIHGTGFFIARRTV